MLRFPDLASGCRGRENLCSQHGMACAKSRFVRHQVHWLDRSLRSFSEIAFIQLPDLESVIAPCDASLPQWPEMDGSAHCFRGFSKIEHLHSEQRQPDRFLWVEQLWCGSGLQSPCKLTVDSGFETLRQSASFHFPKLLDSCMVSEPQVTCPCVH